MLNSSARGRKRGVLGCSLLGCAVSTAACCLSQGPAWAAAGAGTAMEIPIARPTAAATPGASVSNKQARGATATRGNPLWAIPLKSLTATRERPLFSPSRRPPAVFVAAPSGPPPPPVAPPAPPPLTLVGTAIAGSQSLAVFIDQDTKRVISLRIGEGDAGWTVRAIHGREAIVVKDRREATVALAAPEGTEREAAWVSTPAPATASPPPSLQARRQRPVAPGRWLDGDGQVVRPPTSRTLYTDGRPPPATWVDGDGQLISPPSRSGKPPGSATWQDGDGQWITPPLAQIR